MMETALPLACFLSVIRPPGIQFENALLQIAPLDKGKCPFVRDNHDIVFQLYTRHNPTVAHSLVIGDDESLFASSIDFTDPTVVYFHAFMETADDGSALSVREAYTHRGDTNVIVVDAQRLEAGPWYFRAAENTWHIGRIAAQLIDYLVTRGLKLSRTHLVGHSLGAQAAGVAGGSIQSGLVSRITGLDPALPLFDKLPLAQRLDPSDAEFVDVIHTDAGIFGFKQQVGHVDFYPNGGISPQPGCELEVVIPKHLVLNKCNKDPKSIGLLMFHLKEKSNKEKIDKITGIARNDNISPHSIEKENIDRENINFDAPCKSPNCIAVADETIKNILNEPKILENRPKRTFINHRQHSNQILEKQNEKRVFRKYIKPDIPKNSKNNLERSGIKINSHKSKKLFNFIPFFTRPETENEKLNKNHEKHERSDAIKTTDSLTRKSDIPHHRQRNFTSFTKPQTIENDEFIKNNRKRSDILNTTETITQKRVKRSKRNETPHHRQRRFIQFFRNTQNNDNNMLLKILDFLVRNRQKIGPTISIIREISTIIKNSNGETLNTIKEQNNIIGDNAGIIKPISSTYNFDFANESRAKTFLRKLFGLGQGNKLIVTTS